MTTTVYPGAAPTLEVRVTVSGVLTNPAGFTIIIKDSAGAETSYVYGVAVNLVRPSTGIYRLSFSIPKLVASVGIWRYRVEMTGLDYLPIEKSIQVQHSPFSM